MSARRTGHILMVASTIVAVLPFTALANGITPDNDARAQATEITSLPFSSTADNTLATTEADEPTACFINNSLWYKFTPVADTASSVSISAEWNQPTFGIYREVAGSLTLDACSFGSTPIKRVLRSGVTYYFQVGSYYAESFGQLRFDMALASGISGRLTDTSGDPAPNACVSVRSSDGFLRFAGRSMDDGWYGGVVNPGTYQIQFACSNGLYVQEWYDNKNDPASSDPVVIAEGNVTSGIDASLAMHPVISGTVTKEGGSGIRACIASLRPNGSTFSSASTDETGAYRVSAPAGEYRIRATDCYNSLRRTQFYSGKYSFEDADPIVTTGSDVSGIDLQLLPYDVPTNDNLSGAKQIDGISFADSVSLQSATSETGETATCTFNTTLRTVWYRFTPSETMDVLANSGAYFAFVGVYKDLGLEGSPATLVEQSCAYGSRHLHLEAGSTYYFQLGTSYAYSSTVSPVNFKIDPIVTPVNDLIAGAKGFSALPYNDAIETYLATSDIDEPRGCGPMDKTVWYRFTPDVDTKVRIDGSSYSFPAQVAVYEAENGQVGAPVACDSTGSWVDLHVAQGDEYLIQLGGPPGYAGGPGRLSVIEIPPPANDNISDATLVSSLPQTFTGNTRFASREQGEPSGCSSTGPSVWYRIEPSVDTMLVTELTGLNDLVVAVYEGTDASNMRMIDCNTQYNPPQAFPLKAGKDYLVQVGGRSTSSYGAFSLTFNQSGDTVDHTFEAAVPCGALCPYWNQQRSAVDKYEDSCLPEPPSPEGSWDDLSVTVPATIDGRVPTHLVFSLSPAIDWDSFICRAEPVGGKYFLTHDANQPEDMCPLGAIACEESAVVKVTPGQTVVLRAYNWSDTDDALAGYSFVTKPAS